MAPRTLTSANIIISLAVPDLFPTPQQLEGFATDDIFGTEPLASAEVQMGVDGKLSAGFVFVPVIQRYNLQANSLSVDFFDNWWASQQVAREVLYANGIAVLLAVGKKWAMTNGFLTNYPPAPDAGKTLKPRAFSITWESILPQPV